MSKQIEKPSKKFEIMDYLDDKIIQEELKGRVLDKWVYSFEMDGKPVEGIGKVGVDEAVDYLAKRGEIISEKEIKFQQDPTNPEYVLFVGITEKRICVKTPEGKEEIALQTQLGFKRQWTKMKVFVRTHDGRKVYKDGKPVYSIIDDPFWFEKGSTKAIRNSKLRQIPEEVKSRIIALAREMGKVEVISNEEIEEIKELDEIEETKTPTSQEEPMKKEKPPQAENKPSEIEVIQDINNIINKKKLTFMQVKTLIKRTYGMDNLRNLNYEQKLDLRKKLQEL